MDANLDFLTWRDNDLPANHSSVKLKSLIDALFEQILPLGVFQLVQGPTRTGWGHPSGLDHLYSNKPDKLSTMESHWTGMSDHKLIKVTRFSKSLKLSARFVRKRCFKNFDGDEFRSRLEISNLEEIKECQNVDYAAELLVQKLAAILDHMAPIRKIQTRKNYAPWLSTDTKNLQLKRNDAQKKCQSVR